MINHVNTRSEQALRLYPVLPLHVLLASLQITLLDSKRSMNIGIFLRQFKM